ncbi:MAG: hypothetical protein ACLRNW_21940 [Neglectibacter sp.]
MAKKGCWNDAVSSGLLKFQFHYLRPAGDHPPAGARCAYRENGPDQNARIVSRRSCAVLFLPGGWHQDCVVKDGTIITSYFDEGALVITLG